MILSDKTAVRLFLITLTLHHANLLPSAYEQAPNPRSTRNNGQTFEKLEIEERLTDGNKKKDTFRRAEIPISNDPPRDKDEADQATIDEDRKNSDPHKTRDRIGKIMDVLAPKYSELNNYRRMKREPHETSRTGSAKASLSAGQLTLVIIIGILVFSIVLVGAFICYLLIREEDYEDLLAQYATQAAAEEVQFISQAPSIAEDGEVEARAAGSEAVVASLPSAVDVDRRSPDGSLAEQLTITLLSEGSQSAQSVQ